MTFSTIQAWSGINHLYIYFTLGVTQTNPPAIYFNHPTILVNISNILSYVIEHYVLSVSTPNCFPVLIFHAISQWQVARPGHIQNFTSSEMVDMFLKLWLVVVMLSLGIQNFSNSHITNNNNLLLYLNLRSSTSLMHSRDLPGK